MDQLPYLIAYAGIAVFAIACIGRFWMFKKMPMHMRWELYPVAHEPGSKAEYGGSYLEEKDWWTKPREVSMWGEIKAMVPEIVFLVALKEHNRPLWWRSFPFHFGLYLVAGCTVLLFGNGLLAAYAPSALEGGLGSALQYGIIALGIVGLGFGLIGAIGLLHRRMTEPALKNFTAPADIFNLLFFIVSFAVALLTLVWVDPDGAIIRRFFQNLVSFKLAALGGAGAQALLPALSVILLSLLVAYIPLTHMSHFIGKYFAYHAIRWNDEPNLPGGAQEARIQQLLGRPVSWAAEHIRSGGGKRSWAEVCTDLPEAKEKK